jgi:hypothetical protein
MGWMALLALSHGVAISIETTAIYGALKRERLKLLLTHQRRHFALRQLGHGPADRYLQWGDVEGRHVVLSAALVVVVDDVLSHVIVRSGVLDVRLSTPAVHDKHQNQHCVEGKIKQRAKVSGWYSRKCC